MKSVKIGITHKVNTSTPNRQRQKAQCTKMRHPWPTNWVWVEVLLAYK